MSRIKEKFKSNCELVTGKRLLLFIIFSMVIGRFGVDRVGYQYKIDITEISSSRSIVDYEHTLTTAM